MGVVFLDNKTVSSHVRGSLRFLRDRKIPFLMILPQSGCASSGRVSIAAPACSAGRSPLSVSWSIGTGSNRLVGTEPEKAGNSQFPVPGHLLVRHFTNQNWFQPDNFLVNAPQRQYGNQRREIPHQLPEQPDGEAGADFANWHQLLVFVQP